jgi:hypothetical protein
MPCYGWRPARYDAVAMSAAMIAVAAQPLATAMNCAVGTASEGDVLMAGANPIARSPARRGMEDAQMYLRKYPRQPNATAATTARTIQNESREMLARTPGA